MRVILIGAPLWAFLKHAPTSDYATEATTFLMTDATLRMDPFNLSSFGGLSPQRIGHPDGCVHVKRKDTTHRCEY
jgi:hypothetical protein